MLGAEPRLDDLRTTGKRNRNWYPQLDRARVGN
jgi:hypothetical protein